MNLAFEGPTEIVAALLAVGFLAMFFRAVATRWPESYFSLSDLIARRVSQSPQIYAAFRLGPVLVVSILVAVTMERLNASAFLAVSLLTIVHIGITNGRGLRDAVRARGSFGRATHIALNVVVAASVALAAVGGVLLSQLAAVQALVPLPTELSSGLWTALLAGTVGAFIVSISSGTHIGSRELTDYSRAHLDAGLWDYAAVSAQRANADVALVRAIMLAENLARPSWVRRLERAKGRVFRQGSYGIMQVQADAPMSDKESVDRAVARLAHIRIPRVDYYGELRQELLRYNPSREFIEMVAEFYYELRQDGDSSPSPADGRGQVGETLASIARTALARLRRL